jgi:DNA-binding HxlR family transcriptional regulator
MSEDSLADYAADSPTRLALNVLAHKWTLLIVHALKGGPLRFTRLRSLVPGVTSQVLAASLRDLERDGIVVRQEYSAVPPHVEYSVTELGASLCEPARAIRAWAEKNGQAVIAARQRYDDASAHRAPVAIPGLETHRRQLRRR